MLKFRSLLDRLTKNSLLVLMLAVALVSSFAYAAGAYGGYGYGGGDAEPPEYDLTIKKNVTGDVPPSVSSDFAFDVMPGDVSVNEYDPANTVSVNVSANSDVGTAVTVNDSVIRVEEQDASVKNYELTTEYYLSQIKDSPVYVDGYYPQNSVPDDIYNDMVQDFYCELDLDDSMILVNLDTSDESAMDPNLPYYVFLQKYDPVTDDYEDHQTYEMRTTKPELVIKNLDAGKYCVSVASETFTVTGHYENDDHYGKVTGVQPDHEGMFWIKRYNAHHGVTKYTVTDDDTGEEVFVGSIGKDTEGQSLLVKGLTSYGYYTITSDELMNQKFCTVKAINAGQIDPSYFVELSSDVETELSVTNNYKDLTERGDLIIRKYVYGTASNKNDRFDFRLKLYRDGALTSECDHDEERYGCYFDGGVATFSLMTNEMRMARGIPCGLNYSLEEYDDTAGDYVTTIDGTSGTFSTTLSEAISISTRVRGSYKYIHEYYAEDPDGSLTLEGTSDIGQSPDGLIVNDTTKYTYESVDQVPEFTNESGETHEYEFMSHAYGKVHDSEYKIFPEMTDGVLVTEHGEQIIVLQYVRKIPPTGGYKYVHEYYFEDLAGNRVLEGKSDVLNSPVDLPIDDSIYYDDSDIMHEELFNGQAYGYEDTFYGHMTDKNDYLVNPDMTYVTASRDSSQVIVLRYIRYQEPVLMGSYKYVHEYYTETISGNRVLDGTSEVLSSPENLELDDTPYTDEYVRRAYEFNDQHYDYESSAYGFVTDESYAIDPEKTYVHVTEGGSEIIILKYIRRESEPEPELYGGYTYIHEYYTEQEDGSLVLDGKSNIGLVQDLLLDGTEYTDQSVERVYDYDDNTYEYLESCYGMLDDTGYAIDLDKSSVVATENGSEIIVLKYIRKADPVIPDEPEKSGTYKYVHEYYFEGADGSVTFEGASDVYSSLELELSDLVYTDQDVTKVYSFKPGDVVYQYSFDMVEYGTMDGLDYIMDPVMTGVQATEDGSQIIILKYIRYDSNIEPVGRTGGLIVNKVVTGNGDKKAKFAFTVVLDDPDLSGIYGNMKFENGKTEFKLSHGQSKMAEGLPVGVSYSVYEEQLLDYDLSAKNENGVIEADKMTVVSCENKYTKEDDVTKPETPKDDTPGDSPVEKPETPVIPSKVTGTEPGTVVSTTPVTPSSYTPTSYTASRTSSGGTVDPGTSGSGSSSSLKSIPDQKTPLGDLHVQTGDEDMTLVLILFAVMTVLAISVAGVMVYRRKK